jgi:DNA-binding NtrC family response regulator
MERKALVVDDNVEALWSCAKVLKERGFAVTACSQPEEAVGKFKQEKPDLVLLDIRMQGKSGFEVLREVRHLDNRVCIIMLSAFGDSETVVRAMKEGADSFVDKPLNAEKLMIVVEKELTSRDLETEVLELRSLHDEGPATVKDLVGKSDPIERVRKEIKMYADTADVVLITGRPGVGKNLVARALHGESNRRNRPFIHRHCGAFAPTVFESAVFGHRKGAFTDARYDKKGAIEAAEDGTLFLDEIGTLSPDTQAKLLLVIESGVYSRVGDEASVERTRAKFIAATNENMPKAVLDQRFREDLFHRLTDAWIEVPPLSERREDILPLVDHFMAIESRAHHLPPVVLSAEARELLYNHSWPANVRGVRQMVRSVIRVGDESVIARTFERRPVISRTYSVSYDDCTDLRTKVNMAVEEVERNMIEACLLKHSGNRRKVAKHLDISYRSLLYKMKKYNLRRGAWDNPPDTQQVA